MLSYTTTAQGHAYTTTLEAQPTDEMMCDVTCYASLIVSAVD